MDRSQSCFCATAPVSPVTVSDRLRFLEFKFLLVFRAQSNVSGAFEDSISYSYMYDVVLSLRAPGSLSLFFLWLRFCLISIPRHKGHGPRFVLVFEHDLYAFGSGCYLHGHVGLRLCFLVFFRALPNWGRRLFSIPKCQGHDRRFVLAF